MTKNERTNKYGRKLPQWIIDDKYKSVTVDCEELRVQNKFSNPNAEFSDDSLEGADTVAFHFMIPEAAAWWLPRYLEFLKTQAASDSNHFTHIEGILTNPGFIAKMRSLLSPEERAEIVDYINWWDSTLIDPIDRRINEETLNTMRLIWDDKITGVE